METCVPFAEIGLSSMRVIKDLEELRRWVINTNNAIGRNSQTVFDSSQVARVSALVNSVASDVAEDYPFYSRELPEIVNYLFFRISNGFSLCNTAAFGELFIIVKHLHDEPTDSSYWLMIHPRIVGSSQGLYFDMHYASAANRAFIEVETKLRELFRALKPGVAEPSKVGDLIGALLTDNGAYHFYNATTPSGRDYGKGIRCLFEGAFSAYRNLSSHTNVEISKEDSFAQIVLASQLMDVLDPRK